MAEDPKELFLKFYNKGKLLVVDMTREQLREHIMALEEIALEAKANLQAARDQERESNNKVSRKGKEWLVDTNADSSQAVTDSISIPKTRASRMNQIEKTRLSLQKAGIDEETINVMVANLERRATEKGLKSVKPAEINKATIAVERATTEIVAVTVPKPEKKLFTLEGIKFAKKENS